MTLATVRSKTERIREFSALPFLAIAAVSLLGAFYRTQPQTVIGRSSVLVTPHFRTPPSGPAGSRRTPSTPPAAGE